jgi:acetyltransferase EpsM
MSTVNLDSISFPTGPDALILFGGGGHGKTLIDLVRAEGKYTWAGIVDDNLMPGSTLMDLPVLGGADVLPELYRRGLHLAVNGVGGIGNVQVRLDVFERLKRARFEFPTVVHPTACIEPSAVIDAGVQVLALTYICSCSQVGFGSVLNAHVVVSHDCVIGEVVNLSPGALLAGGVKVEDHAQVGMGTTINLNLTIGRAARVGNGATVKADVPAGGVVPAGTIWPPRQN